MTGIITHEHGDHLGGIPKRNAGDIMAGFTNAPGSIRGARAALAYAFALFTHTRTQSRRVKKKYI